MSTDPLYFSTPHVGSVIASGTLDVSTTAPTNVATVFTAGASGSKIEEIVVEGLGTTVAGLVRLFLYDGATYNLLDEAIVQALTASTTAPAYRWNKTYPNLILPSGWSLRFTQTLAGNVSLFKVTAFGADA